MSFKAMAYAAEQEITKTSPQSHLLLILASFANDFNECYPSINTMMSKTRLSDKTVRKTLKDLTDLGLIKDTGKTSKYATKIYKLILKDSEVTTPSKNTTPSKSTTGKNSETPSKSTSTPLVDLPPNTVIESIINPINKDIYSEKPKKSKSDAVEKPNEISEQTWNDFLVVRKAKKAPLTQTAWKRTFNAMLQAQEKTGHSLQQILEYMVSRNWSALEVDWYLNALAKNQNTQGHQNAINQPTYSPNHQQPVKSDAEIYRDKLMAEYDAFYGTASESAGSQGFSGNVYDLEKPV